MAILDNYENSGIGYLRARPMRAMAILTLAMLAPLCVGQCQESTEGSRKVWITNGQVWMETATGPRQLTKDGTPKRLAVLAPDGKRVAYPDDEFSSHGQQDQPPKVVVLDNTGKVLRQITPEKCWPGSRFDKLEWIDNRRIGAMYCGHANCVYWILSAATGKTLQLMEGGFNFLWSHNRKWVARRFVSQLEPPLPPEELDSLTLNESPVYPPEAEVSGTREAWRTALRGAAQSWHGHSFGPFTWSPHDVWLGFADTVTPENDAYVVLASPTGVILREKLPVGLQYDIKLRGYPKVEWDDDTHLHLVTGGRLFRFVVESSELHRIDTPTK